MRIAPSVTVLSDREVEQIHGAVLRIMGEVGMRVQNSTILERLADLGGQVEPSTETVTFPSAVAETLLAESDRVDWDTLTPAVHASAPIYLGYYLDPDTDRHVSWSADRLRAYAKVAHYLDEIDGVHMLGCPVPDIPPAIHPLYQRYFCWKHGIGSDGSIWDIRLCPYILEMCEAMASATGQPFGDYFSGCVYTSSALQLPRTEAEQFVYFAERGLHVGIGHMSSAGGSAPATIAGAVALHIAEGLLNDFIQRAFYGSKTLHVGSAIAPLDMRTLIYPFGRPEVQIANLMVADMARYYGAAYHGLGGHSDAKRPGSEAGVQRALTTIPVLLAGGSAHISAGLLSVDEVFSPIQMVLDNELVSALRRFINGCEISEETLAVDVVKEVGPGGVFTATDHTAAHFRTEFWEPRLWSRELVSSWVKSGGKSALDRAREVHEEIRNRPDLPEQIDEAADNALRGIMDRAARSLT